MECKRDLIYFSAYENGVKTKRAGYAAVFTKGEVCDMQMYYRGNMAEAEGSSVQPVYVFRDGTVIRGNRMILSEGMATASLRTSRRDFVQSGRTLEELEAIYIDGVSCGICGGRMDGREIGELQKQPEAYCPRTLAFGINGFNRATKSFKSCSSTGRKQASLPPTRSPESLKFCRK